MLPKASGRAAGGRPPRGVSRAGRGGSVILEQLIDYSGGVGSGALFLPEEGRNEQPID